MYAGLGGSPRNNTKSDCNPHTNYDLQVSNSLVSFNGDLRKVWGHTLFHLEDVAGPSGALGPMGIKGLPDVFTPFKDKVERMGKVKKEEPSPQSGDLPLPGPATSDLVGQLLADFPSWERLPWPSGMAPAPPQKDIRGALAFKVTDGLDLFIRQER